MSGGSDYRAAVAQTIRAQRTAQRWSLRELSERAGLSTAYLSELENGLKEPSGATLEQLARSFGQTPAELILAVARTLEANHNASQPAPPSLEGLTADDVAELRRFADWLRWRRAQQ